MIARASGLGMGVGRFSRPLRGVGVLAMPDAGRDITRRVESISNNASFRLKHLGVPDGSDGSDGTSYHLTENYTLPVALHTYLN